jgi:limonene-1,2-epoxide hydrolase
MRIVWFIFFLLSTSTFAKESPMSIADFFNKATYDNMDPLCRDFYDKKIKFIDPLGEINGIDEMIRYYKNLYKNVISIRFDPINSFDKGDEKVFVWQMHLKHKKVGGGEPIVLDGVSVFKYKDDKVIYHRDYFDLGAMIYEKIPVLGSLVKWIREMAHGAK